MPITPSLWKCLGSVIAITSKRIYMNTRDRVALIIAAGLISWGIIAIGGLAWRNKSFTEGGGEILLAIVGGLGASLAAYFAVRNGNNKHNGSKN